jgi:hypothetical protein
MSKFNGRPGHRDVGKRSIEFALTVPIWTQIDITGKGDEVFDYADTGKVGQRPLISPRS